MIIAKDPYDWKRVNRTMERLVEERVSPGAVLLVWKSGEILYHGAFGSADTGDGIVSTQLSMIYDLASLTKPLATTLAILHLVSGDLLGIESSLREIFRESDEIPPDKRGITVRHLLTHTGGLPAYRPYYKTLCHVDEKSRWKELWNVLLNEPLRSDPGRETCYSDLGFLVLQEVVERISGESLWELVREKFYVPLGLNTLLFSPGQLNIKLPEGCRCVATEFCPWRKKRICGEVHDKNAYVLGGVAAHAGLFGTAEDICRLLVFLYRRYLGESTELGLDPELVRYFWKPHRDLGDGSRALGFDTPSARGSSSGSHFGPASVGHLGFTGTSFWFELEKEILVILLTNRVYWGRDNDRIRAFRPLVHDEIMECLGLTG